MRTAKDNIFLTVVLIAVGCVTSCNELKRPVPNPYLAESQPPSVKELRWSNGASPKTLDPARAAAAPETDIIRTAYEGLTVTDPTTLEAGPGVAKSWTVSADGLEWTFTLRDNAKWTNGRAVTANDFARSWQRLNKLGAKAAHKALLDNFARQAGIKTSLPAITEETSPDVNGQTDVFTRETEAVDPSAPQQETPANTTDPEKLDEVPALDIRAVDASTFVVKLVHPDKDFPLVVAHPIFDPVYGDGTDLNSKPDLKKVTNGPFSITTVDENGVSLERSESYWNRDAVELDRITFVATARPDDALAAYRDGKVDVVTNTEFAPLAQKLFSPYADFKSSSFAALNFYTVNIQKAPFNDRRVREALAISIEREKLSESELEGTTQPAFSFLPFAKESNSKIVQDKDRAGELLEQAGFPNGYGFPRVRLVINRNEVQNRVARAAARMWKSALNIETDIVVAEPAELEEIRTKGNYDLIRRGVVFPTASEYQSLLAVFDGNGTSDPITPTAPPESSASPQMTSSPERASVTAEAPLSNAGEVLSESQAVFQLHAIPLYFPMSFSLVKPYVLGFEPNGLDVRSSATIAIDGDWRPQVK